MPVIRYLTAEKVVEYNYLVLSIIKVKKGDKPQLLSKVKLDVVLDECQNKEGDIYDKAVVLLK